MERLDLRFWSRVMLGRGLLAMDLQHGTWVRAVRPDTAHQ